MNVLSVFDGISCARLALDRANISINKYYASEIDKYALQIANKHYPYNINLGNIKSINPNFLPKIHLMIGGFPCQSFSIAGKRLEFKDGRGKLFFDMMYLFDILKPKYFLFENVKMKKETRDAISKYIGVDAVEINSNLFSAQNRKRLYWTNIPFNQNIQDSNIFLQDILEHNLEHNQALNNKSCTIDANYYKGGSEANFRLKRKLNLPTSQSERRFQVAILTEQRTESAKKERRKNLSLGHDYCPRSDKEYVLRTDNKSNTVMTGKDENILYRDEKLRILTPLECERLQTIPDNYTLGVSSTQRYKMIGNAFTVDVIAHILKGIKNVEP